MNEQNEEKPQRLQLRTKIDTIFLQSCFSLSLKSTVACLLSASNSQILVQQQQQQQQRATATATAATTTATQQQQQQLGKPHGTGGRLTNKQTTNNTTNNSNNSATTTTYNNDNNVQQRNNNNVQQQQRATTTTIMSSSSVWFQLYYKEENEPTGQPVEIEPIPRNINALKAVVLPKLDPTELAEVFVYPPDTERPFSQDKAIDPGDDVPTGTTSKNPLIVVAPPQQHTNGEKHFWIFSFVYC